MMEINRYSMNDISKIPNLPGVYVWYCYMCIGKADIQSDEKLLDLLESYSVKYGRQQMSINASLNFNLEWEGHIAPTMKKKLTHSAMQNKLSEKSRDLVGKMFSNSQHLFFQPLYIGKAEISLRKRISQHVMEFMRLKELINTSNNVFFEGEDDFAQRAAALGYNEDQLSVYTMDIGKTEGMNADELGKVVSLVEMYLNRWSAPLLGRR